MEQEFTEQLYENQGIVHKICSVYFNNRVDMEDYQQELIIQLWKAFPKFDNKSKFSTWMYRVCLNAAIDIARKEKNKPGFGRINGLEGQIVTEPYTELSDNQEKLYNAINKLNEIDKAIITLYLEDFSYKEIAKIIGISENNTGVKINRIKSFIQKTIENGN